MQIYYYAHNPLQQALWKAAKVGHFKAMRALIKLGANPFIEDPTGINAISYALMTNPWAGAGLGKMLYPMNKRSGGVNEQ